MYIYRAYDTVEHKEYVGTASELEEKLGIKASTIASSCIQNTRYKKRYRFEREQTVYSNNEIKSVVDDNQIIEFIENGGTYEELAVKYGIDKRAMRQYCVDRGYVYKNRGHIKLIDSPRNYYGEYHKICPVCEKIFNCYNPGEWGWTIKGTPRKAVCSWSCVRKYEKEHGIS